MLHVHRLGSCQAEGLNRSLVHGNWEDARHQRRTEPGAFTELLDINLNYAIKQMCSVGHGQLFIS